MTASVILLMGASAGATMSASASSQSTWYWTSAFCKSELQKYGVSVGDGRTYNVQKAFCVGLHDHCWLNGGLRRYKVFDTVMRSYDGVVRTMVLTVTGHRTWRGSKLRIAEHFLSSDKFIEAYGPAAWTVAAQQNQATCLDIHP